MRFKKGEICRFKTLEQMKREYKIDTDGDMNVGQFMFTKRMKYLCGKKFKISFVYKDDEEADKEVGGKYYDEAFKAWIEEDNYSISFNMLIKCSKNKRID